MGKLLNNPKVVVPLALASLGFITYQMAPNLLQEWPLGIFQGDARKQKIVLSSPLHQASKTPEAPYAALLLRERWMPERWRQFATIGVDPFLTSRDPIETIIETLEEDEEPEKPEEKVVVDQETFQNAITANLGLDRYGYFVTFDNILAQPVRKRVGDKIYIKDQGTKVIPTFGIAEKRRETDELKILAASIVSDLKLLGVGSQDSETSDGGVEQPEDGIAFIEQPDGSMKIFKQGDLVYRNPNLGLDRILKTEQGIRAILVDKYAGEYELSMESLPPPQE